MNAILHFCSVAGTQWDPICYNQRQVIRDSDCHGFKLSVDTSDVNANTLVEQVIVAMNGNMMPKNPHYRCLSDF